jgi:transposase
MIKLSKQDKNWQEKTILLLDGASYHRSKETRNYLANKGVKVVIGGPYAFAGAPIEHFFSALKCVDLNPDSLKTGKK